MPPLQHYMDDKQLIETWEIHDRINLYLLDAVEPEHLKDLAASKGRSVGEQIAHIHNVRLMWLKQAAPELIGKLAKVEKENATDKRLLQKSLAESGAAINQLLTKSIESGGKVKGFKPHVAAFLGYLISHESHHRGQIALSLKQSNHPVSKEILFGIWEWGVR
ncbi:MAG TPA: DinB family protein [Pyrinomonadaceae bacterium]|nr:DinB family protein [Pyrinomonadaceae bacterium]